MKKYLVLFLLMLVAIGVYAQSDSFKVKEGSFHHVQGCVTIPAHTDQNDLPMGVIKIIPENINEQQRMKLKFEGNLATGIEVEQKEGETWVYVTAKAVTFLRIKHPDFGVTEFYPPMEIEANQCYEMVLQYVPIALASGPVKPQNNFVTIVADQPNAAIYIDDEYIGDKEGFKSLPIGSTHTWKIECELFHTESGSISIDSEEAIVIEKTLRPAYGFLNVDSKPESKAIVYINNKRVGETPYSSDRLASGTYKVRVMKEMFKTTEETFVVADGQTTNAVLDMSANFVETTISTDALSDIYVDEQFKAKGQWSGRLSEGTHFIEVKKDKHRTVSKNVNLTLGKNETIMIDSPEPIYGFLEISSSPIRADIYIDGQHIGQTPRVINDLLIGNHELKLQKQGCATSIISINITEGETLKINETLQTGKEITITTGQNGDKIYVDDNYMGESPLTVNLNYGNHEVKAMRGDRNTTKNIDVKVNGDDTEVMLTFGKLVTINSSANGDEIYVDGRKVGTTPMEIDLSLGSHEVEVRRGKLYETKTLQVSKNSSGSYNFVPRKEPLDKYLSRGINFLTLNAAYSVAPQMSYGLTYGHVKKLGWFVSAMTNFGFRFGANEWEELYYVNESTTSGNSSKARLSLTGGLLLRLGGPVYMKLGAGYGVRVKCWELSSGEWYEFTPDTYRGVDLTAGLMFNTNGCAISADVVTTNFKTLEFKLGIGINWN
ncbi:MAG: PEGA domain-containing protein [Bacteroidales bacterium]|nr:PEGA domain-containing protein [Bacteroidales bacterium]